MKNEQIPIVAQFKNWLVVNKPAGISVHNDNEDLRTILKRQLSLGSFQDIYPVHRLDKETSGLIVIATDSETAAFLATQFQQHEVKKNYTAVLRGSLAKGSEWTEWNAPVSDKSEGRKNPQGLARDRVEARTLYRVLESNKFLSLVEFKLLTGRQHQIRKHSALARHAIVGDARYGDPKYNAKISQRYQTTRMFLHASALELSFEEQSHRFEAPLPEEFREFFVTSSEA